MARDILSVSVKPEPGVREHVEAVAKAACQNREDHESEWHSIADLSGYGEIVGLGVGKNGGKRPKMRALMDSHPIKAFRTLTNGMYSGLSSPNRPWIDFEFIDPDLNEYQVAREWLDSFRTVIYDLFAASNFYQAARSNYGEMGRFGPCAGIMTEHWREIAPTIPLKIGQYWLVLDDALMVDTLIRGYQLTVKQVVGMFVSGPGGQMDWSKVSTQVHSDWDRSNYANTVSCKQTIEPGEGKQYNSFIWDERDDRKNAMLQAKAFAEKPFWATRWESCGNDPYGRGIGHDVLADLRELHMQAKAKRELSDLLRKPPTAGIAKSYGMRPGDHTYVADASQIQAVRPVYEVNPMALQEVRADLADIKQAIDALTYADLFMAITQMPGVQPRNVEEILKRDEEKLTQIGPVVEMVNDEMLPVAVNRMIGIAQRGGLLPPAPPELQGKGLKVKFVSVLAMAQKMMGISQTERFVGFVGSLASVFGPSVLDKIDPDAITEDYAERTNVPAVAVRDEKTVNEIRTSRQQQQQAEMAMASAAPAKDATAAARNIAEMSNDTQRF